MTTKRPTIKSLLAEHPDYVMETANQSSSFSEILEKLSIAPTNTRARETVKAFLLENNVKLPSYNEYRRSLQKSERAIVTKEDILNRFVKSNKHYGTQLRKWVITYNLIPYLCSTSECPLSNISNLNWCGKEITLDLDHINGDSTDNELSNLRFLCPNCHSQTETYKGHNKRAVTYPILPIETFSEREATFNLLPEAQELQAELLESKSFIALARRYNVTIRSIKNRLENLPYYPKNFADNLNTEGQGNFNPKVKKIIYPVVEELVSSIEQKGWEEVSRNLGVTGNAVRNHLRSRKIDIKTIVTPFKTGPKSTQQNK